MASAASQRGHRRRQQNRSGNMPAKSSLRISPDITVPGFAGLGMRGAPPGKATRVRRSALASEKNRSQRTLRLNHECGTAAIECTILRG
jgi:hypothetical protein